MDNKPLENLAEDYIKTRLTKAKIKFLKPSYDVDGSDLVLLQPINKHLAKQIIVQSKGRTVKDNPSNISIDKKYVTSNFICFLYIDDGNQDDHFFVFFNDSIKKWKVNGEKFILNIPLSFKNHSYFNSHRFDGDVHIGKIQKLFDDVPILQQSYVEFESMQLTELLFEMWRKYDSLPDLNLACSLYDKFYSLSGSISQDIFLVCCIGMHTNDLPTGYFIDHFMQVIFESINLSNPIEEIVTIYNPDSIKRMDSWAAIVYPRLKFGSVQVNYDGINYKALYCYIGDKEDHVEAMIFDNGQYISYGHRRKHER